MNVENSGQRMDFSSKKVLVTGGASGIGAAVAKLFTEMGATVCVMDLAASPESSVLLGDVSSEADVQRVTAEAIRRMGSIDVLVNNAANVGPQGRALRQEVSAWRRAIDVNVTGTFLMSKAAGAHMVERGSGAIVNIASIFGMVGVPHNSSYNASKAGVVMLTRSLACEWSQKGVRVNCVAPGFIRTEGFEQQVSLGKIHPANIERRTPMGRLGLPLEIAHAVAYLASDWASYVTGATLPVDGGWTAFGGFGDASQA